MRQALAVGGADWRAGAAVPDALRNLPTLRACVVGNGRNCFDFILFPQARVRHVSQVFAKAYRCKSRD